MLRFTKIAMFAVTLVILLMVVGFASAQDSPIAVVSLQEALSNHPGLADAQQKYQATAEELTAEISELGEQEQEAAMGEYQQILQQLESELQQELLADIEKAIAVVAERLEIATVLEQSALLYGGQDITEYVIDELQL